MVAAFATVSFTVLLAAAALTMDGGALITERRHAQEVADAAALAAAADLYQHYPLAGHGGKDPNGTAASAALGDAKANGYTNDGTTSTVTVNIPPKSGLFTNATPPGYAEVIVTYNQPPSLSTFFSLFGSGSGSGTGTGAGTSGSSVGSAAIPVKARAVARGQWVPANPQIIVFDLSAPASLLVTNNLGSINVQSGPVIVNSSDPAAASNTTPATFAAPGYRITGGVLGSFTGPKTFGTRPMPDPLFYLPMPTSNVSGDPLAPQGGGNAFYNDSNPPPNPLPEGFYDGGITVTGSTSLTLQPNGTYVMRGGGFNFNSSGNLTGNGVLIYNQPSPADLGPGIYINNRTGGTLFSPGPPGTISLSPLTTGPYQGITLFEQQSGTNSINLFGSGGLTITGTIYAANATASVRTESYNGHDDVAGTQFMVRQVLFSGLSNYTLTQLPNPAMQRKIGLVE
jgi:hypothetical protein